MCDILFTFLVSKFDKSKDVNFELENKYDISNIFFDIESNPSKEDILVL